MKKSIQLKKFNKYIRARKKSLKDGSLDYTSAPGATSSLNEQIMGKAYDQILDRAIQAKLAKLQPGQTLHLKRGKSDPNERSISIVCDQDGNYIPFIETKSKFFDNDKRHVEWFSGSYKKGKFCYRIDSNTVEAYISLITRYKVPNKNTRADVIEKVEKIKLAVEANNELAVKAPDLFLEVFSNFENRTSEIVIHQYAKFTGSSLYHALENGALNANYVGSDFPGLDRTKIEFFGFEIERCKLDIFLQILKAIEVMHKIGYAHKDLKPENILVSFNKATKRMEIKVIDIEHFSLFDEPTSGVSTSTYLPPEYNRLHKDLNAFAQRFSLGNLPGAKSFKKAEYLNANKKHDIWSAGIILLDLLVLGRAIDRNDFEDILEQEMASEPKSKRSQFIYYMLNRKYDKRKDASKLIPLVSAEIDKDIVAKPTGIQPTGYFIVNSSGSDSDDDDYKSLSNSDADSDVDYADSAQPLTDAFTKINELLSQPPLDYDDLQLKIMLFLNAGSMPPTSDKLYNLCEELLIPNPDQEQLKKIETKMQEILNAVVIKKDTQRGLFFSCIGKPETSKTPTIKTNTLPNKEWLTRQNEALSKEIYAYIVKRIQYALNPKTENPKTIKQFESEYAYLLKKCRSFDSLVADTESTFRNLQPKPKK